MRSYMRVGVSLLASYGAGLLGSLFVSADVVVWYASLVKPSFMPPGSVFAPVWFILYGCMAASLAIIWSKDPNVHEVRGWVPLFFVHLLLNAGWTLFFFGFHAILIAFIDILLLLVAILLLFFGALPIDKRAAWLLIPYFLWVLFATILNAAIWFLN